MIAKPRRRNTRARVYAGTFLELLPLIREQARVAFRDEPAERRDDLISEVYANCWIAFVRLMDRGLKDAIYATPLAQYAIRQIRDGRRVGTKSNCRDVSSIYSQQRKGFVMESLDRYDQGKGMWKEVLVEDRHAGPAETAACRIDFGDWLQSLPEKSRKIAETLAMGETTNNAARKFNLSTGRISQMRRELKDDWQAFHGEAAFA